MLNNDHVVSPVMVLRVFYYKLLFFAGSFEFPPSMCCHPRVVRLYAINEVRELNVVELAVVVAIPLAEHRVDCFRVHSQAEHLHRLGKLVTRDGAILVHVKNAKQRVTLLRSKLSVRPSFLALCRTFSFAIARKIC